MNFQQVSRFLAINYTIVRNDLDRAFFPSLLFLPFRLAMLFNPRVWFRADPRMRGERIRRTLEVLGPVFVKFGQVLSTRRDLLEDDIADELVKLQDQVPAFSEKLVDEQLFRAYKKPISQVFSDFEKAPLASASVAQVHRAKLLNGHKVVVKILRPGIEKIIRRDIGLMYTLAGLGERLFREGRRLRLKELVAEFEQHIYDELDLVREAANASQLKRNFKYSPMLHVPEVYWELTSKDVMVMEYIKGVRISDMDELNRRGVNLKRLAEYGVEIFFTQVFRDCFFHADMHPGNIFVDTSDPMFPKYMAVDFGIMGSLSPKDQLYLAQNFMAFFERDYRRVAELHVESGWVPKGTRVEHFESAIRGVCEPIFEKPLKDISFGKLLLRLFQTAGRFNMEIQPQLMMLQKTLFNIEGLGRVLYPDLDLWATAKPFLEDWLKKRSGVKSKVKGMGAQLSRMGELSQLPHLLVRLVDQMAETNKRTVDVNEKGPQRFLYFMLGMVLAVGFFVIFI